VVTTKDGDRSRIDNDLGARVDEYWSGSDFGDDPEEPLAHHVPWRRYKIIQV